MIDPRRPGDIDICYADCTKAKEELGWEAQYGSIRCVRMPGDGRARIQTDIAVNLTTDIFHDILGFVSFVS